MYTRFRRGQGVGQQQPQQQQGGQSPAQPQNPQNNTLLGQRRPQNSYTTVASTPVKQEQQQPNPSVQPAMSRPQVQGLNNFRGQQNQQQQKQAPQQLPQQQPLQQQPLQQQQPPKVVNVPQAPSAPIINPATKVEQETLSECGSLELEGFSAKKFWSTRKGGVKISKQEQQRRRNLRLGKLLQPKNAVMIFNELVKNPQFEVVQNLQGDDASQYRASVLVDGQQHSGFGRNKIQAKNNAAELAIRYLIRKRKIGSRCDDEQEKMEVEEETSEDEPIPWQHVASLALFKLFDAWGDDTKEEIKEAKPAKKLPDKPESLQPLMLLNQMLPNARFEEVARTGQPPATEFTYKCSVDGQEFIGKGPRAKLAKRMAAFAACHKLLNVNYPPEVWQPLPANTQLIN